MPQRQAAASLFRESVAQRYLSRHGVDRGARLQSGIRIKGLDPDDLQPVDGRCDARPAPSAPGAGCALDQEDRPGGYRRRVLPLRRATSLVRPTLPNRASFAAWVGNTAAQHLAMCAATAVACGFIVALQRSMTCATSASLRPISEASRAHPESPKQPR